MHLAVLFDIVATDIKALVVEHNQFEGITQIKLGALQMQIIVLQPTPP